jgi:origin recognition complex subunit 5
LIIQSDLPSPPSLVVHGPEATGKTSLITSLLQHSELPHAIVNSKECITGRQLLERTVERVITALNGSPRAGKPKIDRAAYPRCESLASLAVHLERLLSDWEQPPQDANDDDTRANGPNTFLLVFDGIDRQRESPPTLLPALLRLAATIPALSILFLTRVASPRTLHTTGTPHLFFPAYTRAEAIHILAQHPLPIFTDATRDQDIEYSPTEEAADNEYVWTRFVGVAWDTLGRGAARDVASLRAACARLWPEFVQPVREGAFGTRDFARLVVARRALFQDERCLVERVVPEERTGNTTTTTTTATATPNYRRPRPGAAPIVPSGSHALPAMSKHLLVAAYLASYNPARTDLTVLSASAAKKKKKRARAPVVHSRVSAAAAARKIPRHLLTPSPFSLERLLAVLRAVHPRGAGLMQVADLYTQVATLTALRLLIKTGGSAGGDGGIEGGAKWRVGFGWEYVNQVGRSLGLEVGEWLVGGGE